MKLFAALALLAIAPVQADRYEASWSSSKWTVVAKNGEAPERVAVLIDRQSVKTGATRDLREFNLLSTVEGMGERWGIIAAIRVDCAASSYMELGRVVFSEGERKESPTATNSMTPIKPGAGLAKALPGLCKGDWSGMTASDGPATSLHARLFN